jgi:hypothetical protein
MGTTRATTLRSRRLRRGARPTAYHVVSVDHARHWRVVRGGLAPACLAEAPTRAQAVYRASVLAQADAPSRLVVHGVDGFVETRRDYA